VLVALVVLVTALPASALKSFLPPTVSAEDFSGSLWHGAAGKVRIAGRDAGALEWRLNPAALVHGTLDLDLHWAHQGFGLDAHAAIERGGATLTNLRGGGPIEDLRDIGLPGGWRGTADIDFASITTDYVRLLSAQGDLKVRNAAAPQLAGGAELGSYLVALGPGAIDANGTITAQVHDMGGPVRLEATVALMPAQHTGSMSGTLRETGATSAGLATEIAGLAQLRGRDTQGRIPIDLEFSF
jgi:general secretion pathway protein N